MPSQRMLLLAYDYPPNDGGISRLGAGVVSEMIVRGVPVDVVTLRQDGAGGVPRPDGPCREVSRARGVRELETLLRVIRHPRGARSSPRSGTPKPPLLCWRAGTASRCSPMATKSCPTRIRDRSNLEPGATS